MSDGPQKLVTALLEQRLAIEPPPGSADNDWPLYRDRQAQLVLVARDLTRLGPDQVQPRELSSFSAIAVLGAFAVQGIMHPSGFWLSSVTNRSVPQVAIGVYPDVGTVLALAGWTPQGAPARTGFRGDSNFTYLNGTTTVGQPFGWNLLGAQHVELGRPLWVEPGRVLAFTCGVANTAQNMLADCIAPITRGVGT